jgi:hypothetical protein
MLDQGDLHHTPENTADLSDSEQQPEVLFQVSYNDLILFGDTKIGTDKVFLKKETTLASLRRSSTKPVKMFCGVLEQTADSIMYNLKLEADPKTKDDVQQQIIKTIFSMSRTREQLSSSVDITKRAKSEVKATRLEHLNLSLLSDPTNPYTLLLVTGADAHIAFSQNQKASIATMNSISSRRSVLHGNSYVVFGSREAFVENKPIKDPVRLAAYWQEVENLSRVIVSPTSSQSK